MRAKGQFVNKAAIGLLSVVAITGLVLSTQAAEVKKATPPAIPSAAAEAGKEITVKGTVNVVKDDKGAVKEVDLKGDDGTTYMLSPAATAKQFEADAGKTISLKGHVTAKNGKSILHLTGVTTHVAS